MCTEKRQATAASPEATPARAAFLAAPRAIPTLAARLVQFQTRPSVAAEVSGVNLAHLDGGDGSCQVGLVRVEGAGLPDQNLDENQLVAVAETPGDVEMKPTCVRRPRPEARGDGGRLCLFNFCRLYPVSKNYALPPFSIGIEHWSIAMAELYFRDESNAWRTPRSVVRPGDPRFVIVANIAGGWLYEIAGPFFWAALILLLVLGGAPPR